MLKDARKDFGDIAKECGLPRKTIWNHFYKMKEKGIIVGATIQYNYKNFGYAHVAEIIATTNPEITERKTEEIEKIIRRNSDIRYLAPLIPKNKWFAGITLKHLEELDRFREEIRQALSAINMKTYIWTDIKNIPENLSLGLTDKIAVVDEKYATKTNNSSKTQKVDKIDFQISMKLAKNGRESFRKIAEEIGISTDTVARRYDRLKRNGVLKTVIQINPSKLGYTAMFDARIAYSSQTNLYEMLKQLTSIPDVICLCGMSGDYDIHQWTLIRDIRHFLSIQEMIVGNPGVTKVDWQLSDVFINSWPTPWQFTSTF